MRNRKRDYFVMGSHCGIVGVVGWCILVAGNNNNHGDAFQHSFFRGIILSPLIIT